MPHNLFAATTNAGKLREFAEAAQPAGIVVLPLPDLANMPEPVEDALTFAGNADIKAIAYSLHAPGKLVFADDSGLEVHALNDRPGVLSARFADSLGFEPGQGSKDERNNRALLALLHEQERTPAGSHNRAARFVCTLSLARDGQVLLRSEGTVEGEILNAPQGANGFGYDPLFWLPFHNQTLAELSTEAKWAISHRGNAFRSLLAQLAVLE